MDDINMDNLNFKSNSNASKDISEPEKKVKAVISGGARIAKKSFVKRLLSQIFGDYHPESGDTIFKSVVVPQIKKMLDDSWHMFLFPNGGNNRTTKDRASRISYRNFYDSRDDYPTEATKPMPANAMDYDDVVFETRGKAERVLEGMYEMLETYKVVSVADFYDLAEIADFTHTTNKYGWTNLSSARVISYGREYKIRLPRAMPID